MGNKRPPILVILLVVIIAGAGILYKTLGSRYAPDQLAVERLPHPPPHRKARTPPRKRRTRPPRNPLRRRRISRPMTPRATR